MNSLADGYSVNRFAAMSTVATKKSPSPDAMHDKQSEPDHRQLRIDKVGVRGLRFPIQIRDKARSILKYDCDDWHVRGFAEGVQGDAHEPVHRGAQFARAHRACGKYHGHSLRDAEPI